MKFDIFEQDVDEGSDSQGVNYSLQYFWSCTPVHTCTGGGSNN